MPSIRPPIVIAADALVALLDPSDPRHPEAVAIDARIRRAGQMRLIPQPTCLEALAHIDRIQGRDAFWHQWRAPTETTRLRAVAIHPDILERTRRRGCGSRRATTLA